MRRYFAPLSVCLALVVLAAALRAGPLDPPAGPISPTYKTLSEVEPRIAVNATNTPGDADSLFKITLPGSYYLTDNITGVVGKHGIEIVASGVTLDLNGFDLAGVPAMGAFNGACATVSGLTNIAVVNGSVRAWGQDGINLGDSSVIGGRVEGVRASGNVRIGVYSGRHSEVAKCTATNNLLFGICAPAGCTISDCSATGNGTGIRTEAYSAITNCAVTSNTGIGILAGNGSTITDCVANSNTGTGISAGAGNTVTNCSAVFNTGSGINTGGSTVAGCTLQGNALDGILCTGTCIIRGNTCSGNGSAAGDGAGIHATGSDNRIEGNTCTLADRGIDVDAAGNIIMRNTCSGNTNNWDVVAGNVILVVNATTATAVTGDSGGTAPGSTDPNANFTF